ncbi:hypothetical protein M0R45_009137 [Rubus argutus]|uniref:Uncharacterized protein n=1 Tax=Rubus argutus TaxID=59490 RepID=A0AAW1Y738_RUBAR
MVFMIAAPKIVTLLEVFIGFIAGSMSQSTGDKKKKRKNENRSCPARKCRLLLCRTQFRLQAVLLCPPHRRRWRCHEPSPLSLSVASSPSKLLAPSSAAFLFTKRPPHAPNLLRHRAQTTTPPASISISPSLSNLPYSLCSAQNLARSSLLPVASSQAATLPPIPRCHHLCHGHISPLPPVELGSLQIHRHHLRSPSLCCPRREHHKFCPQLPSSLLSCPPLLATPLRCRRQLSLTGSLSLL